MDFEIPFSVAEIEAAKQSCARPERSKGSLRAGDSLARLRATRRFGAEQHHPSRRGDLGMAELFRSGAAIERHQARYRRVPAARSENRAGARQSFMPLRHLHHLQASRRTARLRRRADVRLAGPRRRMHRRQHFLHPRR